MKTDLKRLTISSLVPNPPKVNFLFFLYYKHILPIAHHLFWFLPDFEGNWYTVFIKYISNLNKILVISEWQKIFFIFTWKALLKYLLLAMYSISMLSRTTVEYNDIPALWVCGNDANMVISLLAPNKALLINGNKYRWEVWIW